MRRLFCGERAAAERGLLNECVHGRVDRQSVHGQRADVLPSADGGAVGVGLAERFSAAAGRQSAAQPEEEQERRKRADTR